MFGNPVGYPWVGYDFFQNPTHGSGRLLHNPTHGYLFTSVTMTSTERILREESGVKTKNEVYKGLGHYFWTNLPELEMR